MSKKRYYVERLENGGSLVDENGKPLPKQITWGVFDRNEGSYEGEQFFPRCIADRTRREDAREECRELNEAHESGCGCIRTEQLDTGSRASMSFTHWRAKVLEAAHVSEEDCDRFVTRERLVRWFDSGEQIWMASKSVADMVKLGSVHEREHAVTREMAIGYLRIAGYHNDRAAFTRLYVENRVSYQAAKKAFGEGQAAKARGVGCTCSDCNKKEEN